MLACKSKLVIENISSSLVLWVPTRVSLSTSLLGDIDVVGLLPLAATLSFLESADLLSDDREVAWVVNDQSDMILKELEVC